MNIIEWRWSNGEEYLKSSRKKHIVQEPEESVEIDQTAISQSLNGFDFETMFSRNDNPSGNKREDLDNKISDRGLMLQRGTNPFLHSANYVNDVVARDIFLKPKNTTFEKIKNENNENNENNTNNEYYE